MYYYNRTQQEQTNDIVAFGMAIMFMGIMLGLFRSLVMEALKPEKQPPELPLLPQAIPEVPIPQLLERLRKVADELGAMSLVEIAGLGRADRLKTITRRELQGEWGYHSPFQEADDLGDNPFDVLEAWLEPGGYARSHSALQGVAQTIVEAAEAKVEKARAVPSGSISDINYRISQRTRYGLREEIADAPGVVITWSNGSSSWYVEHAVRKGVQMTLDANNVFVPYPRLLVEAVLHKLEPLPLGKNAFEAIAKKKKAAERLGAEGIMESDERWLEGLRRLGLMVYAEPGYSGAVPATSISAVPGLVHIGGGNLSEGTKLFRLRTNPETGTRFYVVEPLELMPQTKSGEAVPPQYRYLVDWVREPLPEYSLLVLPAVVPEAGERKIDSVLKQLKDGVEGIQQSDEFRLFLSTMAKFHNYSIGNLILIAIQKPGAIHVAGFSTWKDLGRWVKKGEKGIAILAPIMPPKPKAEEKETGEDEGSEIEPRPVHFKVVYVFDVRQTEGKPLAEFEVPVLTGEPNANLFDRVLHLAKSQELKVSFESRPQQDPDIKGMYFAKTIWVRPEESGAQQLKTLLHEVAHYYSEGVFHIPRRDAETIAESAAFAVGEHFGFDTGIRSFPYVALWAKDKKVLEQNLAAIRKVATQMIETLEEKVKRY
jgi:hypothetical protein